MSPRLTRPARRGYSAAVAGTLERDFADRRAVVPPADCRVCGNRAFRRLFAKKGRDFWRCLKCGFETQSPLPSAEDLRRYYDDSYAAGMYRDFADAHGLKAMTARRRFDRISPFCRPGRWLDVGCSTGIFVDCARRRGRDAEGIDLSSVAVAEARRRGLPVLRSTIEDYRPAGRYDAITAFDVVEHVLDPAAFLQAARRLLVPGGSLALYTPNLDSAFRRLMGRRWFFYIPEEHFHFFNPRTLRRLLVRCGFQAKFQGRAFKPVTIEYGLGQLKEYNPFVYSAGRALSLFIPRSLRQRELPLPIGEMIVIAEKVTDG